MREQSQAKQENREVVSQSVTLYTDICPSAARYMFQEVRLVRQPVPTRTMRQAVQQPNLRPICLMGLPNRLFQKRTATCKGMQFFFMSQSSCVIALHPGLFPGKLKSIVFSRKYFLELIDRASSNTLKIKIVHLDERRCIFKRNLCNTTVIACKLYPQTVENQEESL